MPEQPLDFQDVLQLVELMKSSTQFSEFKLRAGTIELELRRGPASAAGPNGPAAPAMPVTPPQPPAQAAAPAAVREMAPRVPSTRAASGKVGAAAVRPEGAEVTKAPMVGTVYLAPEPGARPFVEVGQAVEAGTQLCIVEVMKLMNAVTAGRKGVVSEILVGDAEPVEFGQPLFVITPA